MSESVEQRRRPRTADSSHAAGQMHGRRGAPAVTLAQAWLERLVALRDGIVVELDGLLRR